MSIPNASLADAWNTLERDPNAVLIDVRTEAEWNFVGVPDLSSIDQQVRLVQWTTYPGGQPNPDFLSAATADLAPDQPILLLCRSGARSLAAANALSAAGFTNTFNVVAGFEGDLDASSHRHGGWKDELPWRQG